MSITYYSIPQADFKWVVRSLTNEIHRILCQDDLLRAKKASDLLQKFLPPFKGNHLIEESELLLAEEFGIRSLIGDVIINMDCKKITLSEGKVIKHRKERVGDTISWIEIEDQKVGA
jgi:hypothetical protein